ncbi:hypothetical protein V470_11065 [Streptococcus sp. VT 162]|nr:hypothetical protein V470_11065 [Streptococcus sp. VT 162]
MWFENYQGEGIPLSYSGFLKIRDRNDIAIHLKLDKQDYDERWLHRLALLFHRLEPVDLHLGRLGCLFVGHLEDLCWLRPVIRIRKGTKFQVIQAKTVNNLRKIFQFLFWSSI